MVEKYLADEAAAGRLLAVGSKEMAAGHYADTFTCPCQLVLPLASSALPLAWARPSKAKASKASLYHPYPFHSLLPLSPPLPPPKRWEGIVKAEVRSGDPEGTEEQGGPQPVTRGIAFGTERPPRQLKGAWAKAQSRCWAAGRVRRTIRHPESSWLG